MRKLMIASAFAWLASGAFAGDVPSFPKSMNYDRARESLLAIGWEPAVNSEKYCDMNGCFERCAPGYEDRCKKYPETAVCRTTSLAGCEFLWKRGDMIIQVSTYGENDPPLLRGVRCVQNCNK
jgi:hypothetical protein